MYIIMTLKVTILEDKHTEEEQRMDLYLRQNGDEVALCAWDGEGHDFIIAHIHRAGLIRIHGLEVSWGWPVDDSGRIILDE